MHKYNTECIVLKRTMYGDADKIYTLLSRDKGKIRALAKGVRKITSRRGGNLDTANHVVVGITENTTGFKTITEVSTLNSFSDLKKDIDVSSRVFYILELINRFLDEGDSAHGVFELTLKALSNFESPKNISSFELALLKNLGYQMSLTKCVSCGRHVDNTWNAPKFNYSLAGVVCGMCEGKGTAISKETVLYLKAFDMRETITISSDVNSSSAKQAENIISHFVRDVLGERIKTVEIFPKV